MIWVALPYLLIVLFEAATGRVHDALSWHMQRIVVLPCVLTGSLGALILWLLLLRKAWLGAATGVLLTGTILTICARLEMKIWGGFEANVGIFVANLLIFIPSSIAAIYAGILRATEEAEDESWPDPRS